jgi:peroxiredoxin
MDIAVDVDRLTELMGDESIEFIKVMDMVQDIIDNPNDYLGLQASRYAALLAAYRTQMIVKSQAYKRKSAQMSERDKIRNDIWKTLYQALEENINTLKVCARGAMG